MQGLGHRSQVDSRCLLASQRQDRWLIQGSRRLDPDRRPKVASLHFKRWVLSCCRSCRRGMQVRRVVAATTKRLWNHRVEQLWLRVNPWRWTGISCKRSRLRYVSVMSLRVKMKTIKVKKMQSLLKSMKKRSVLKRNRKLPYRQNVPKQVQTQRLSRPSPSRQHLTWHKRSWESSLSSTLRQRK